MNLLDGMLTHPNEGHVGHFIERQELLSESIRMVKPKTIIETGFNMGHSTLVLCQTLKECGLVTDGYWIFDICYWNTVRPNFQILKSHFGPEINLELIEGDSKVTLPGFDRFDQLDFAVIDGEHSFEGCKSDIDAVINRVRPGGMIIIDDYKSTKYHIGSVDMAVDSTDWTGFRTDSIDGMFRAQRI